MAVNSPLQRREQRVVIGGALLAVVSVLLANVALPFARHWSAREAEIRALRAEAASLAGLVTASPRIEAEAGAQERALSGRARRVFHARSMPLASSALQALLQDAADAAHLVVTRLDVAQTAPGSDVAAAVDSSGSSLPATLVAYGDVVGLAALLDQLTRAPRVVHVERMTVQQNSSLRGAPDMLQITLALRAPVLLQ